MITRAAEILAKLENGGQSSGCSERTSNSVPVVEHDMAQLSFFAEEAAVPEKKTPSTKEKQVLQDLKELEILEMTPLEAMNTLYQLHKKLK